MFGNTLELTTLEVEDATIDFIISIDIANAI